MSCPKCGGKLVGVSGDVKGPSGSIFRDIVGRDCVECKEFYPCCLRCFADRSDPHVKWCNGDERGLEIISIYHLYGKY